MPLPNANFLRSVSNDNSAVAESGRAFCFLAILFAVAGPAAAATLPSGFSESLVATGLANPTAMQFAPDGRLFVCEQGGRLRVIKDGVLLPTPFVTLSVNSAGERGLLGVAFDPDFATNHYVYVYYTAPSPVHNRISRFTANGDVAVPGSEFVLLDLNNLSATNHNGGALNFGPDGKLYAAVGENAVGSNAQSMNNLLGKMLRLNADGTIPADNPFFFSASGQNRAIWALGLRNPFTFAFNPVGGRDVHQRRRRGHLGGNQRRLRRRQLRMAGYRGNDNRSQVPESEVRLQPLCRRVCDYWRSLLLSSHAAVPSVLRWRLLLRRLLRRLDQEARPGERQ